MQAPNLKMIMTVVALAVLTLVAFTFLTAPDRRSLGNKMDDALQAMPQGIDRASEQLESRTPGQKLGDAIKHTGEDIKDKTAPQ